MVRPSETIRRRPLHNSTLQWRLAVFAGLALSLVLGVGVWSIAEPLPPEMPPEPSLAQAAAMATLVAPPAPESFAIAEPPSPPTPNDVLTAADRAAQAEAVLNALSDDAGLEGALALYDMPRLGGSDCVARLDRYLALVFVPFERNSAALSAREDTLLERISTEIAACPHAQVLVAGHADGTGTDASNIALSKQRARAVHDRLATFDVDPEALEIMALGASAPIAQGSADETAADRRVDFRVLYRP